MNEAEKHIIFAKEPTSKEKRAQKSEDWEKKKRAKCRKNMHSSGNCFFCSMPIKCAEEGLVAAAAQPAPTTSTAMTHTENDPEGRYREGE